jgi:hypothetical protein
MRRLRCAFPVLLLAALLPFALGAQQQTAAGSVGGPDKGFILEQNRPNPVTTETRIPFQLLDEAFVEGRPATVTFRIYNILTQFVGSPTTVNHPAGDGVPIVELQFSSPGAYEAAWDGRDHTGSRVASGVYVLELIVNGRSGLIRMMVQR